MPHRKSPHPPSGSKQRAIQIDIDDDISPEGCFQYELFFHLLMFEDEQPEQPPEAAGTGNVVAVLAAHCFARSYPDPPRWSVIEAADVDTACARASAPTITRTASFFRWLSGRDRAQHTALETLAVELERAVWRRRSRISTPAACTLQAVREQMEDDDTH